MLGNIFFFEKILFSDESNIFPNKCGKLYIRKAKIEELELNYAPTSNRNSRTVILRGIISTNTVGLLFMYKRIIDGKKYLKMLEDHLLQSFSQLKGTRTIKGS